ncbi:hypothetical protein CCH79_00007295 [Gambusia affinis]|uniref:Uncharacterized protein n=1 Tax=Gambusia affinis TaxID=33528 RepID=A0A315VC21_GAMAF|nr:hypothetical protein CCH79_00007295 [Gambusia affinis]
MKPRSAGGKAVDTPSQNGAAALCSRPCPENAVIILDQDTLKSLKSSQAGQHRVTLGNTGRDVTHRTDARSINPGFLTSAASSLPMPS